MTVVDLLDWLRKSFDRQESQKRARRMASSSARMKRRPSTRNGSC